MFVENSYRWVDDAQLATLNALMGTSSLENIGDNEDETVMSRLIALANSFVDGIFSVFEIRAERIETDELCVDGVCITADDLRNMLEGQAATVVESQEAEDPVEEEDEDNSEPELPVDPAPVATSTPPVDDTASTTEPVASTTDPVVEEEEAEEPPVDPEPMEEEVVEEPVEEEVSVETVEESEEEIVETPEPEVVVEEPVAEESDVEEAVSLPKTP